MGALVAVSMSLMLAAGDPTPSLTDVGTAGELLVQYDGRVMPLDTMAHRTVELVTGNQCSGDADVVAAMLSWVFESDKWKDAPLIEVGPEELAAAIDVTPVDGRVAYTALINNRSLRHLIEAHAHAEDDPKIGPLREDALELQDRAMAFGQLTRSAWLPVVPTAGNVEDEWTSPAMMRGYPAEAIESVRQAWDAMGQAFRGGQTEAFATAMATFVERVSTLPNGNYPVGQKVSNEIMYNHLQPVRAAWMLMLAAAALGLLTRPVGQRWFDGLAIVVQVAGFAVLTLGLMLRWGVAGRIPAANFYESLVLLGWGVGLFSLIALAALRDRTIPLNAAFLAGLFLAMADLMPIDPWVRPIQPVLRNTAWMSIHVPIIMLGYAVLAQAVILGHIQVGALALGRAKPAFLKKVDWQLYWCLIAGSLLLLAGILTGSMWANSSWGRYWGWDPKEVWSLAAFFGYMALIHARWRGWLGQFGTAAWSIAAIWLIVATYLVVNFVLPAGLHSYATGSSNILMWMIIVASVEAGFVCLAYLLMVGRQSGSNATVAKAGS